MCVGSDLVSPTEFWNLIPWEIYWIIEGKTRDSEPRKQEEAKATAYDLLKAARGEASPPTLEDIRRQQSEAKGAAA
jgi:hypothetical protein